MAPIVTVVISIVVAIMIVVIVVVVVMAPASRSRARLSPGALRENDDGQQEGQEKASHRVTSGERSYGA